MSPSRQQPSAKKCRVLVICPQALLRAGLRLLLAQDEDLEIVELAADACEALQSSLGPQSDVVIVAFGREDVDCKAAIRHLLEDCPDLPLLVVSSDTHPAHVQQALACGASGYLPLDADLDQLLWAVNNVANGELTLHPAIMRALASHLADEENGHTHSILDDLSPREQEVLSYIVQGLSDRDVAQALFISVRTVQAHLSHVYTKLGVHSRTEAAVMAVRAGWFPATRQQEENQ
jgi:DNA-binding NarL/FixJ family response regulator